MVLTPDQELENAIIKRNYFQVCELFGLTEKQALLLNTGSWMVDIIKQLQTSNLTLKALKMEQNARLNIENYEAPPPLPDPQTVLDKLPENK
jgi:hypothetical protein